jgi:hypothetical protein
MWVILHSSEFLIELNFVNTPRLPADTNFEIGEALGSNR